LNNNNNFFFVVPNLGLLVLHEVQVMCLESHLVYE